AEDDLRAFADVQQFPIIPCDLCGSQDGLERKAIARLLDDLEARCPGAKRSMLAALKNVRASHLFDQGLWSKLGLEVAREGDPAELAGADSPIPVSQLLRDAN